MEPIFDDSRKKDFFKAMKYSAGLALLALATIFISGLHSSSILLRPVLLISSLPLLLIAYIIESQGSENIGLIFGWFILPLLAPVFVFMAWTTIIYMLLRYIRSRSFKDGNVPVLEQTEVMPLESNFVRMVRKINTLTLVAFGAVITAGLIIFIIGEEHFGSEITAMIKGRCLDRDFVTFEYNTSAGCFSEVDLLLVKASRWLFNISIGLLVIKIALAFYLQRKTKNV